MQDRTHKKETDVYICMNYCIYMQGSLNEFPDFFLLGTFIDSTHMKL